MVIAVRKKYNEAFTEEKYQYYLNELKSVHPRTIEFPVAETPVFIGKSFKEKILSACENIVDVITQTNFSAISKNAVPKQFNVANENNFPHFIAFDFGICENEQKELEPQLIEMQGFPSLFAYEVLQDEILRKHFPIPENYSAYLNGFTKTSYLQLLKEIIVGEEKSEQVILLELFPHQQKTRIDFYATRDYLNINIVCLTELIKEGNNLFYIKDGNKVQVKRIYNRVIFDELQQQSAEVQQKGKILFEELNVEWIPHPNWFYRISKYTLPFINHPYVPATVFLDELQEIPTHLEDYVLKPLFSFAGQGVIIDVTAEHIQNITDKENWVLQRKVKYAEVIETPDTPAKAEIRIFYFWKEKEPRPVAVFNLARLSKGKMIGVRYNADKTWVGGTIAYFEK
jgi:hypothetical protein